MRAAVFFLLPFLGSCRHLAPRGEVPDPKRQIFDNAVSVCYTYTTTYLTTVPVGSSASGSVPGNPNGPGTATVTQTNPSGQVSSTLPVIVPTTLPAQSTATPSPVLVTTISAPEVIVLSIEAPAATAPPVVRKRQVTAAGTGFGYIAAGGNTTVCAAANTFMVENGTLMDTNTGVLVSANTNLAPINLNNPVTGTITTEFTIVGGILVWSNARFYNGAAVFCQLNNIVYAVFTAAGPPAGCTTVNLIVVQANVCLNIAVSASAGVSAGVSASASISAGVSASLSGGVTVPSSQVIPTNPVSGVSESPSVTNVLPSVTSIPASLTIPGVSSTSGAALPIASAYLTLQVGESITIDLGQYFDLLGNVVSFTTIPSVSWISFSGTTANTLLINVPATAIPGDNVEVILTSLLAGLQSLTFDLFITITAAANSATSLPLTVPGLSSSIGPIETSLPPIPSTSLPALTTNSIAPPPSTSSGSVSPVIAPTVITLVQGQTFDVLLTPLLNVLSDLVQGFATEPVVSWINFGKGGTDLSQLVGTVPVNYPPGNVYVAVTVLGSLSEYEIPLYFEIVAASLSSTIPVSSPIPTIPSLTVTPAAPSSIPATSTSVAQPITTSVTVFLGQPFDIDLTPLFTSATDLVVGFSSSPVVDWLALGTNIFTLVGTVPANLDVSVVTVYEDVSTTSGNIYTIIVTLNIAPYSASSSALSLPTTAPIPSGPTTAPPILPSSTLAIPSSTTSAAVNSLTTDINLVPGEDFSVDLTLIGEAFGALSLVLGSFSVTPAVSWVTAPILSIGDYLLIGTVPIDTLPGTVVIFIQGLDEFGVSLNIFVDLVISEASASSSSASPVSPATSTVASSTASSTPSLTPFVIPVAIVAGQPFTIDGAEVIADAGINIASFLDVPVTPDFVTFTTIADDLVFSGTAPLTDVPTTAVISFLIADSTGVVTLINLELDIAPAAISSAFTSSLAAPSTVSASAAPSSTSAAAAPVFTLATLVRGQTFFYDLSTIVSDLNGDIVTDVETPADQAFINVNQIPGTNLGDQTISGTVPDDQPLGTYIVSVTTQDSTGARNLFSLALIIVAPTASASTAAPSSLSLTGQPLPSSSVTPTQSSTASSTSATPFATIITLTPGQTFNLNADLLVVASGYLNVETFTVSPVEASDWITLSGDIGAQILSGTVPLDYPTGSDVVIDLLSLGTDSVSGDVDTYFNVLVELVIVAAGPGASSSSLPAGPSFSTDFTPSSVSPGGSPSTSAVPETSSAATPEASSSSASPEASSSFTPETSSSATPEASSTSEAVSSATPESSPFLPSSSLPVPESSSSQEIAVTATPSSTAFASSATAASTSSTSSQGPLPTDFEISPFQDFDLDLSPYLQSVGDVVTLASPTNGFSINGLELVVSPAAGLLAGAVASITLNVVGALGPYTLPFSFFVLPSTFTISAEQDFVLDLTPYLQASTDVPSFATSIVGLSLDGDIFTINPIFGLLAGITFTTPIQVLGAAGLYSLPFSITVLPLAGSSSTNLASQPTSSVSPYVTPSSSFPLTSTAASTSALASQSASVSCQLTGTLPTVAICDVSPLQYFSLGLLQFLDVGAVVDSIATTTPPVSWLTLDAGSQLLIGLPPVDAPPSVLVTLSVLLDSIPTTIQIEIDVLGAQLPSSTVAPSPSTLPALATTSSVALPTPPICRPSTDDVLAVAICDVVQTQYFSLSLSAYLSVGATVESITDLLDVSAGVDLGTVGWLGFGASVLSGYPPTTALGEYLVTLLVLSADGVLTPLFIELNVLGSPSSSSQTLSSSATLSSTVTPSSTLSPVLPTTSSQGSLPTSSFAPVTTGLPIPIPVVAGQANLISLAQYLGLNFLNNAVLSILNIDPAVDWVSLVAADLEADVPVGATGIVNVTLQVYVPGLITTNVVLELVITTGSSPSSASQSTATPTPTSSASNIIITSSSTIFETVTMGASTSSAPAFSSTVVPI